MRKLAFLLVALFLVSTVSAIQVKQQSVTDVIIPEFNQPANIQLAISDIPEGSYNLYTLTDVKILPSSPFQLGNGINYVDVSIFPLDSLKERGIYIFTYNIHNIDGPSYEEKMQVEIVNLEDAFEISSGSNDPDSDSMTFFVNNKENVKLRNVRASFSSVFFDVEETFDLEPFEKRTFSVSVDKDRIKTIEAGSYLLKAEFDTAKGVKSITGKIYLGVKEGIETTEDTSGLLIRTASVSKVNVGNVVDVVTVSMKRGAISRLFTTFNNEPTTVSREGLSVNYFWVETLQPAEVFIVRARTNYFLPLLIVAFIMLLVWGFKHYTENKLEIKKTVSKVRTKKDEFALKVKLSVKARKSVENVSLMDRIPAVVKIYEKFETVKPDKIDTHNRRISWNIGDLKQGEERIFSYVVYSKIGVVGKFSLPGATAIFERDGDIHESISNEVFFLNEDVSVGGEE